MTRTTILAVALLLLLSNHRSRALAEGAPPWLEEYRAPAARLIGEATSDAFAWHRLATLTDTIEPSAQRLPAAGSGHAVGSRRDEARRPRERARREGDGAEVGPWQRKRRHRPAHAPPTRDARPGRERRHASRGGGGTAPHRAVVSRISRRRAPRRAAASCCSTCPSPATAKPHGTGGTAHRAQRVTARSPCSSARLARTACVCRIRAR